MALGFPFSWHRKDRCLSCDVQVISGATLCGACNTRIMAAMQQAMAGQLVTFTSTGTTHYTSGGSASGQYWGASTPFYGSTTGPTYTSGIGGTVHTAANFPNALGAGTRNLPIENAGIRAGEIIAFRCWILTKQEVVEGRYRLCSTYANCVWEPNKVVGLMPEADPDWPAIARENPAEVIAHQFKERKKIDPHDRLGVRVGIHAFKNAGYMMTEFAPSHDPSLDRYLVYGTVALWGDVIEHRHGFRAEYAKINTLDAIDSGFRDDILDKLRHIYGVEGKSYRDFKIGVKP